VVGDPTNGPVVHAYGGNLVTWKLAWSRIDRVSDLDSVQRDDGRHYGSGGCEVDDVVVRLEVGGARSIKVWNRRLGCNGGGQDERQPHVRREHYVEVVPRGTLLES